jgi:hypothetical protein
VKLWKSFGGLFERLLMRRMPFADGLLLDNLRAFSKPAKLRTQRCQFLGHSAVGGRIVFQAILEHLVGSVARHNTLIPNIAGAVPFENQAGFGNFAWSKSKRVSDSSLILAHGNILHRYFAKSTTTRKVPLKGEVSTHKF